MILALAAILFGLVLLVWSADKFVDASVSVANYFGISQLIIGMVIVGFGTSAPELCVSAISSFQGSSGIALGNAFGSNIANIGLILGFSAIISPIIFKSSILKKELPFLLGVSVLSIFLLRDLNLSRIDAFVLLAVFAFFLGWSFYQAKKNKKDILAKQVKNDFAVQKKQIHLKKEIFFLVLGLVLLIVSSRFLVWGAVTIAELFGVSDLVIGLTIVAVGTSLPELASSIMAIRKKQDDLAVGNILGSNVFNTLAVVGLAGMIYPLTAAKEVFSRDLPVMIAFTCSLFIFGYGFKKRPGSINRIEGSIMLLGFVAYTIYLIVSSSSV